MFRQDKDTTKREANGKETAKEEEKVEKYSSKEIRSFSLFSSFPPPVTDGPPFSSPGITRKFFFLLFCF